jgi:hypothetical protein
MELEQLEEVTEGLQELDPRIRNLIRIFPGALHRPRISSDAM